MLIDRFEIRPIDPAAEWQTAAGVEAACFPPHEACKPDKMKARAEAAPDFFLVAIDRKTGTMAGILNGLGTDEAVFRDDFFLDASLHDPKGSRVFLLGLAVLPAYRGQGLARALMEAYAAAEKARGGSKLVLTCLDQKVPMYEHMGFCDLGMSASSWGGEAWHEMERTL